MSLVEPVFLPCLALLLLGLAWLAAEDLRHFEISPAALALTGGGVLALHLLRGTPLLPQLAMGLGTFGFGVLWQRLRPSTLGTGDLGLLGLVGLAAGPGALLASVSTFAIAGLATSLLYLRLRGKPWRRWRRSAWPAAPAGALAILAGLLRPPLPWASLP